MTRLEQSEVNLCEPCWQEGFSATAIWFPSGVPMCLDHYLRVCIHCKREWQTNPFDRMCDECWAATKREAERRAQYDKHLSSKCWWKTKKKLRRQSCIESGYVACARCGMRESDNRSTYGEGLHGHHRTYERFGQEKIEDIELLCSLCHAFEHGLPPPQRRDVCVVSNSHPKSSRLCV